MKRYEIVEISERELEDLIRKEPELIETGLVFVDHQHRTPRGPLDVLFADSGKALVVAELKVVEDDGMLDQGLDYYDYIVGNLEGFVRAYKEKKVERTQLPRLFLIAPSFSQSLLNRCKWIDDDVRLSLFTFQCLDFKEKPNDYVLVFKEVEIPAKPKQVEVYSKEQILDYITNVTVHKLADTFLEEVKDWDKQNTTFEPTQNDVSMKVNGRVFAYLSPRRDYFLIYFYDEHGVWSSQSLQIRTTEDSKRLNPLLKRCFDEIKAKSGKKGV